MNFFGATIPNFKWLSRKSHRPDACGGFATETPCIRVSKTKIDTIKRGKKYTKDNGAFIINEAAMKELNLLAGDKVVIGVDLSSRKVAFKKSGQEGYTLSGNADREAGMTAVDVRGTHVKSTVKFQATEDYISLVGDGFYVELSDCEIDGNTVIIPCPDIVNKEESPSETKKVGRPRKYKPKQVEVSENESRLFNLAMEYAKENDTSFEKAFSSIIKTDEGSKLYLDVVNAK